jgi:hypothetical protein
MRERRSEELKKPLKKFKESNSKETQSEFWSEES